jgi:hypothetical protein
LKNWKTKPMLAAAQQRALPLRERADVAPGDLYGAGIRRVEPRDEVEQRGLAGAARPQQRDDLACRHVQVDTAQHVVLRSAVLVRLVHASQSDQQTRSRSR